MKQIIKKISSGALLLCLFAGCAKYLDVVPDGVATMDNAFSNRNSAEKFLFGCYSTIPNQNDPFRYPGNVGADDMWYNPNLLSGRSGARIARGEQNATDPFQNYWDGRRDGQISASNKDNQGLWVGIRDCNIFLENIDRVPDLRPGEMTRWIAEIKFIKAYLHYFLLQLYGPIPIMDVNLPVNADPDQVRMYRQPVEEVVEYIVNLLDECYIGLPNEISATVTEMGRITQVIVASVKAKVLVWAASPLLNGNNPDYVDFKDNRGVQLIPSTPDPEKWERALAAIDTAIVMCHRNNRELFKYDPILNMSDETMLKYTLRGVVTERPTEGRNSEIIWAHPAAFNANQFQQYCFAKLNTNWTQKDNLQDVSATLKMAEQYYSNNGVPIDEDEDWAYSTRYETERNTDTDLFHKSYIKQGETTAKLNYYREPRFYAHLAFDRSLYEMVEIKSEDSFVMIDNLSGKQHGNQYTSGYILTGYFIKKLVSPQTTYTTGNDPVWYRYSMPLVRLADLYLLRAEAANEMLDAPNNEVYDWIDMVRYRAGLEGVVDSWRNYASPAYKAKPSTKEGMREIIRQERLIELAFEGQRSFDLRRWKIAMQYQNDPVQGWNYSATDYVDYYRVITIFNARNFTSKDYFWPIYQTTLTKNNNLVQNPGW